MAEVDGPPSHGGLSMLCEISCFGNRPRSIAVPNSVSPTGLAGTRCPHCQTQTRRARARLESVFAQKLMNDPIELFRRFKICFVSYSGKHHKLRIGKGTLQALDDSVLVVNVSFAQKQQCRRLDLSKPVYRRW